MSKKITIFIVIFMAIMLQVSFLPNILPSGVFPDVALIIVIFWAARSGFNATWPWAILGGLMLDFIYFWPIGTNVFSFVAIVFGASYLAKRFLVADNLSRFFIMVALVISGTVLNESLTSILMKSALGETVNFQTLFFNTDLLLKIIYNLLIFMAIYVPLLKLEKFIAALNLRLKMAR
ncbi:MAG: rod shape-determining protein MreD [Patescibacteria group bacterium]